MPSWFKPGPIHSVIEDEETLGRVNTRQVARWLHQECDRMGVEFLFHRCPDIVERNQDGSNYRVSIGDSAQTFWDSKDLDCSNIVVAAGSSTTGIVDNMFNNGDRAGLGNRLQKYYWPTSQLAYGGKDFTASITVKTTNNWSDGAMTVGGCSAATIVEAAAVAVEEARNHPTSDAIYPPTTAEKPLPG